METCTQSFVSHLLQPCLPIAKPEILDNVRPSERHSVESDLRVALRGFANGRVADVSTTRKKYWRYWVGYCSAIGYDPYLPEGTPYSTIMSLAMAFAGRVRSGGYGVKKQVSVGTVRRALGAVNTSIALDTGRRPFYEKGSKSYHAPLSMMLDGFGKADPATVKKLPCTADLPELLCTMGNKKNATPQVQAVGDLVLIAFYF